ncbi:MAG: cytochrome c biogenesis protein CcdA [Tumebacillaceae bacterium]
MFDSSNPTFLIAFLAGLLSFVSPCCLPLYPSYLSYITGVSYDSLFGQRDQSAIRRKALMHSIFFVIGFSSIFIALGFSAGVLGSFFVQYQDLIRKIGGIMIILMGLFLSGIIRIDFLLRQVKLEVKTKRPASYFGAVLVGISFAAGWTPCIGPILASILMLAMNNPVSGGSLMLFYSLGFAIPFLVMAYTLGSVRWLLKYSELISKIGGIGMILMGILLFTNAMTTITQWLISLFGGFTGL